MHVALVTFDGFTDLDLFLLWDLLGRAAVADRSGGPGVRILGTEASHVSAGGLRVPVHGPLEEAARADAVLFVSGPTTRRLCRDRGFLGRLALDPGRQQVGSMCSGALLLAGLGLLEGRSATTYPTARAELERFGVTVVERAFVAEGNVATAAGCLAALELAGWVLRRQVGEDLTALILRSVQPVGAGLSFADAPVLEQLYQRRQAVA